MSRLDSLLADDFLCIGEQGFVLGKQEWIGKHGDFRYLAVETTEVDVQRSRASWRGNEMTLAVRLSQV